MALKETAKGQDKDDPETSTETDSDEGGNPAKRVGRDFEDEIEVTDQHNHDANNNYSREEYVIAETLSNVEESLREWKKTHYCVECGKQVENSNLWRHRREFHNLDKNTFPCSFCGKIFTRKQAFNAHKCQK